MPTLKMELRGLYLLLLDSAAQPLIEYQQLHFQYQQSCTEDLTSLFSGIYCLLRDSAPPVVTYKHT